MDDTNRCKEVSMASDLCIPPHRQARRICPDLGMGSIALESSHIEGSRYFDI
jgi:hypothetical protein